MNTKTLLPLTAAALFAVCAGSMLISGQSIAANAQASAKPATPVTTEIVTLSTVTVRPEASDLAYFHSNKIVDLATLTGACVVALGTEVAGMMSNNQPWCDAVLSAARRTGEPAWQLPMFPEIYDDLIKSEVADIKNVGEGRWGGAITAAKFLERFVGGIPWTHIDIAGPAFAEKPRPWIDGGGTGSMVRAMVELVRGK